LHIYTFLFIHIESFTFIGSMKFTERLHGNEPLAHLRQQVLSFAPRDPTPQGILDRLMVMADNENYCIQVERLKAKPR
jgi:hypothetical protein